METNQEPLTTEQLFSRTQRRTNAFIKRQIVVGAVAAIFGLLVWNSFFEPFEKMLLDRWLSRSQTPAPSDIVLVTVSEKSLEKFGPWPWSPEKYLLFLEVMVERGAKAVYLEQTFFKNWTQAEREKLVALLAERKVLLFFTVDYHLRQKYPTKIDEVTGEWSKPYPEISELSAFGHRLSRPDPDRVFRNWMPILQDEKEQAYLFTALKMMMDLRFDFRDRTFVEGGLKEIRLIPWSRNQFKQWPRVEFVDLVQTHLAIKANPEAGSASNLFKDKIIFVGLADENRTFSGLTPWRSVVFPVEIVAAVFDGLSHAGGRIDALASGLTNNIIFYFVAFVLMVWSGMKQHRAFWFGWVGILALTGIIWKGFALFGIWAEVGGVFIFMLVAANALFIFDLIYAKRNNSTLFQLATRDGLTNLYTIRHFRVIMNQVTLEARARREALGVILMDIDYFKKINDTYGHPAGDMVIKRTAEVIQSVVRQKRTFSKADFVARYGGEEFIVLVRRSSLENTANLIAERIRLAIANTHYEWQEKRIFVTMSLGVSALNDDENIPDPMVRRADKALYLAKRTGRNRVCTQDDPHLEAE